MCCCCRRYCHDGTINRGSNTASAGSVERIMRGETVPKMSVLNWAVVGHRWSKCSTVSSSRLQCGQVGDAEVDPGTIGSQFIAVAGAELGQQHLLGSWGWLRSGYAWRTISLLEPWMSGWSVPDLDINNAADAFQLHL